MQINVVGVKFKNSNHIYSFSPNGLNVKKGDYVIVETERGEDLGVVVKEQYETTPEELVSALKNIVKIATPEMVKKAEEYDKKASEHTEQIKQIVKSFNLDMKIVKVEANFDNSKLVINFTSDNRVDFRELVKKLAETFKTRVELRQIGSRDEVRMLGGFGPCGKICCCVQNFGEFDHVSMKMAKNQNLSLNPNSISGLCGKLMCCLAYENQTYQESIRLMPKINCEVKTKDGVGVVVYNNLLDRKVDVKFTKGDDSEIKTYDLEEIKFNKDNNIKNEN